MRKFSTKQIILVSAISIVSFLIIIMGVQLVTAITQADIPKTQSQNTQTPQIGTAEEYLRYINAERAKIQAPALIIDPTLNKSAKIKADDLVANNYFEHVSPSGKRGTDIIQDLRPIDAFVSENLAQCSNTIKETMEAWKKSPIHYNSIIDKRYRLFGSYAELNPYNNCVVVVNHFSS